MPQGVHLFGGVEVDAVYLVDHVPKQVAVDHPVLHAAKHGGNHVAAVATVYALQAPQVGKEAGAALPVRADRLVVIDEGD